MVKQLENIKVSVITPVYNQSQFIEQTIRSVLNQNYPDIEFFVLDDGSTDEIQKIIEPFVNQLIYISHENIGESRTVNEGYKLCSGDIVGVVNADDPLFAPDAITRIIDCFQENPDALAVYPDWVSINEHGGVLDWLELPQYSIDSMLREFNVKIGPGMFIKRTALESIGYRNESLKYTGDLDVSFRLALLGKIEHVRGFLATHRVHGKAASSVGKGAVMAEEVARLCKISLESPLLPRHLLPEKNKILGQAYFISAHYTKKGGIDYYKRISKALCTDSSFVWKRLFGFAKIFPYRIWPHLPLILRKNIKRLLKRS
ncbi:MAG: glycosyltransferase [Anaerolineaceae bacterium]